MGTVFLLGMATLTSVGCNAQSRISGTYIACGSNDGAMLQLTQATGGQITGVISLVQLDDEGTVKADSSSITGGTLDGSQLTLTVHPGIFGTNISGTRAGNTIRLQSIDRNGRISSSVFTRGSSSEFSTCTDHLQQKSAIIKMNANLSSQIRQFSQAVQDAEEWIKKGQLQASRIPTVEDHYSQIQEDMQTLVERERNTGDYVNRSQLSVEVNQKNVDGSQFDIEVNQAWEWPVENQIKPIFRQLASSSTICNGRGADKPGTEPTIRNKWESGCHNILTELSSFQPIAQKIMEQRSELKTYQAKAKSLREATVTQAEKLAQ